MPTQEGVIKYQLNFKQETLAGTISIERLQYWFKRCHQAALIGQQADRYDGYAFGNISQRDNGGFLISGSQTGGLETLQEKDICRVSAFDINTNELHAEGPIAPSSEAMTHGQIYQLRPNCNFVIHVHSPELWRKAAALGIPTTAREAEYGTPEMAREVERLLSLPGLDETGLFSMGGHEDGIVAFAEQPDLAGEQLFTTLQRAMV